MLKTEPIIFLVLEVAVFEEHGENVENTTSELNRTGGHPRYGHKAVHDLKKRSRRYRYVLSFSKSPVFVKWRRAISSRLMIRFRKLKFQTRCKGTHGNP